MEIEKEIIMTTEENSYKSMLSAKNKREIIVYTIVGFGGAILDFLIFYSLIYAKTPIIIAQWFGASAGFIHNHLWHHYKVFTHSKKFGFTTTTSGTAAVIGVILSGPMLAALESIIPNLFINKIIIVGIITILLFIIRKKWIFTSSK